MCNACSIFLIACIFCFNLNSAWQNKQMQSILVSAPAVPPGPPGFPKPAPIWPWPPPGEEYRISLAFQTTTTAAWKSNGVRTRSTPAPIGRTRPEFPKPVPIWPLPPPGEDYDRLLAEQMKTMPTGDPYGPGPLTNMTENRRSLIPVVTFDILPFWERHDPTPERRTGGKKHKLRKQIHSTQTTEYSAVSFRGEDDEANTKWPKVRSRYERRRDYRSTRLPPAPYKLMLDDPTTPAAGESTSNPKTDGDFNPYSIKDDLETMLKDIDEANFTVEVISKTVEYNDIVICKITQSKLQSRYFRANEDKYMDEEPEKKIIFIVHGLSPMGFRLVPCLSQKKPFMKLLKYYTAHLDKFDIFIVPMANPDGIGDETIQYWNKNKSPQSACLGVALDRNFDVSWNASSRNSCNQQYPGPAPFSELESRAVGDVLHYFSHKIVAYIHVHAGTYETGVFKGDAVLYPKGFTEVTTEDDKYIDIKGEIDEAIRNAGFKVISVSMETLYTWYGKVHGSSVDFASTIYGVPYAMEFVMQPYEDNVRAEHSDERVSDNVLTEIWKRVIDVVFTNIYKNTRANDVK